MRIAILLSIALLASSWTTASAAISPSGQIKLLKRQVTTLKKSRDRWITKEQAVRTQRDEALAANGNLTARVTGLEAELKAVTAERDGANTALAARTAERDNLQNQNDQLRAGLPDAIKAVPLNRFWELVFTPARATWPCDSYYSSGSYWSLDFQSLGC